VLLGLAIGCGTLESRTLQPQNMQGEEEAGQSGRGGSGNGGGRGGGRGGSNPSSGNSSDSAGIGGDDAVCGDGVRQGSEQCDDGNLDSGDGCDSDCQIETTQPTCGNGVVEGDEECDDGNLQPGDGCDATCKKETCGDGRVEAGEECDPPKAGSCTANCKNVRPNCGNGKVDPGEQCDDGNDVAGDGCTDCVLDCGDKKIDASAGEQCEPAYSDHCSSTCQWLPTCGDGMVQTQVGEQCDPSNGVTCVDCKLVTPQGCSGDAGCGGAGNECTPDSDGGPVQNGNFDTTSTGWTNASPGLTATVVNDGSPAPMALELALASSTVYAEAGITQCVAIPAGTKYELQARYLIPAGGPSGVGAAVLGFVYKGTQCSGTSLKTVHGPQGTVQNAWTPYSFQVDTTDVSDATTLRLLLRLDIVRPPNVDGAKVRWDSVTLVDPGPHCGDCIVQLGEQCDDGNHTSGDGCSADCRIEACGDGIQEAGEECDDGNTTFGAGDKCTPACRNADACDTCSETSCQSQLDACFGLTGTAQAGPRAGTARSTLCDELRQCVRNSSCDLVTRTTEGVKGAYQENCYCGTSGDSCFDPGGDPNGSCRAQVEAALETTDPKLILERFDGTNAKYPIFAAVKTVIGCEDAACTQCKRDPTCGDGLIEDRNFNYTFTINRQEVPCADDLTATGHGCSFEECDLGQANGPDNPKCDANCFIVACGNNVVQYGEECDDGNHVSGDGCSADCKAEFTCGNHVVEPPYEDCDPDPQSPQGQGMGADCTPDQAKNDPSSCACDKNCKFVVCGDGVRQSPWEDCDPPNGTTCGTDCKLLDQGPCMKCINEDPEYGPLQATYCTPDTACLTVELCIIAANCFNPLPSYCYCGTTDTATCKQASFQPTGPCRDVIAAGSGSDHPDNETILNRWVDTNYSAGLAYNMLNYSIVSGKRCADACTPQASP
jgi:cysteine-rich repeat protein